MMPSILHHADAWHLLGNLAGIAIFAPRVVRAVGLLASMLLAAGAGELANTIAAASLGRPVIGASAAVFVLAGLWLALFPRVHMARAGIGLMLAVQVVFAAIAPGFGGVAWLAHVLGAGLGVATGVFCQRSLSLGGA